MIRRSEREAILQRRCVKLSCELSSVGSADPRRVFDCAASLRCPPFVSAPGYWSGVPLSAVCFEVISWTGFRPIDAVSIGPGHVDRDGVMVFRQSKVKAPAFMPRTAAGVEKCAHSLRKSRGFALAEGGASAHQFMSWGGWQTLKEAEHYCRLADRRCAG
ncbi:hypothetical protein CVM50_16900 [Pseudooceanicola marinus]|nr:hypothetical protein CVM50_16900 [Pseudooceanicola marinus]